VIVLLPTDIHRMSGEMKAAPAVKRGDFGVREHAEYGWMSLYSKDAVDCIERMCIDGYTPVVGPAGVFVHVYDLHPDPEEVVATFRQAIAALLALPSAVVERFMPHGYFPDDEDYGGHVRTISFSRSHANLVLLRDTTPDGTVWTMQVHVHDWVFRRLLTAVEELDSLENPWLGR